MVKPLVMAIHGFLGQPSDWDFMRNPDWDVWGVDLNRQHMPSKQEDWQAWADRLIKECAAKKNKSPKIIMGYSMGGRLALSLLSRAPELFDGAIIVSANPGIVADTDKQTRYEADMSWAMKFLQEPWENVMQEWNAQSALTGSIEPNREESEIDREVLAHLLRTFSLGLQPDFRTFINEYQKPLTWMTGDKDLRFTQISNELKKQSNQHTYEYISGAGHRLIFDKPQRIFNAVTELLTSIEKAKAQPKAATETTGS